MLRNWSGAGGDDNIPCTCTHVERYATGPGWGGGMITFLALVHMLNATQLVWGGGDDNIPCTCTHVECYATGLGWGGMITFLALVHMLNRLWQDLKGFLGRTVSSKNTAREVNPRLKTYVYAYMFRRNADNVWHETGQLCN